VSAGAVEDGFVRHVGPATPPLLDPLLLLPLPLELLLDTPLLLLELTPLELLLETNPPLLLLLELDPNEPELLDELLLVSPLTFFCGSPGSAAQAIPTHVAAARATMMGPALPCMDLLGVLRSARSLPHLGAFITA